MGSNAQMNPAQINAIARAAIKARAVKMTQPIFSGNFVPATTPQVNVIPRNVGLILGFWVKVVHTISNTSGQTMDLTDFGVSHALSQIVFTDLNNTVRIQDPGWHLAFINSVKGRRPFGSSLVKATGEDSPIFYGANRLGQISLVDSITGANETAIANAATGILTMWYYVPLAYSDDDLRGSVYGNVTNATMQLTLAFPGTNGISVAAANGADSTLSLLIDATGGATLANVVITNTNLQVYQVFYDQLPVGPQGLLLPLTDLATIYELKQTVQTGVTPGQDFGYQYANFRDILSTTVIYVNTGASGARGVGADINFFSLQAANATNIWKKNPDLVSLETRNFLEVDPPPGMYYFGSRAKPISTTQYGNMQLILNPVTAAAGAYELVGVEDFALIQTLSMAGSLASS